MQVGPNTRLGKYALGVFVLFLVMLALAVILYGWLNYPPTGFTGVVGYAAAISSLVTLLLSLAAVIAKEERSIAVIVCMITAFVVTVALTIDIINAGMA
jgi:polyferredoxin